MMKLSCRIVEGAAEGWDVYFPTYSDVHVATAVEALTYVTSLVQSLPEASILSLTWEPRTSIGRSVVKVVTA